MLCVAHYAAAAANVFCSICSISTATYCVNNSSLIYPLVVCLCVVFCPVICKFNLLTQSPVCIFWTVLALPVYILTSGNAYPLVLCALVESCYYVHTASAKLHCLFATTLVAACAPFLPKLSWCTLPWLCAMTMLNNSDSVAGDITCLIVCALLSTSPLSPGTPVLFDKKSAPPLCSLFLVRLDSNLHHCVCTADFVSLHSMSKSYLSVVDTWEKIKKGNLDWKRKRSFSS